MLENNALGQNRQNVSPALIEMTLAYLHDNVGLQCPPYFRVSAMKPTPVCLVEFHTFSLLNDFCNLHTLCTLI